MVVVVCLCAMHHLFFHESPFQYHGQALEMIVELKKAFNELLENLEWMDQHTKDVAREKVYIGCRQSRLSGTRCHVA